MPSRESKVLLASSSLIDILFLDYPLFARIFGRGLLCCKPSLITDFIHRYPPHRRCPVEAIGDPSVDLIKALCSNVIRQDPEQSILKSKSEKACTSSRHKVEANTPAPLFRIDIEATQLSVVRQIRIARRRCSGKPADQPVLDRYNRPRLLGIVAREIIPLRSIFGAKLIEKVFRKKRSIRHLPRPDVHTSYVDGVVGFGWP